MTATQRFLRAALLSGAPLLLLPFLLAGRLEPSGGPRGREVRPTDDEDIARARGAILNGFTMAEAEPLRPALARRVKIYVDSDLLGVAEGYYGAEQLLLVFRRLFEGKTTVRFAFVDEPAGPRSEQAVLAARWVYKEEGDRGSEARIAFTLSPEGPAWRIREIRDLK